MLLAGLLLLSSLAIAEEPEVPAPDPTPTSAPKSAEPFPRITSGHFSFTGGLGFGYASGRGGYFTASPQAEYFVVDRLALGLATSLYTDYGIDSTLLSLGPSATYHFWNRKQISSYIGGMYMLGHLFNPSDPFFESENVFSLYLGANYNPAEWFGLGPKLIWRRGPRAIPPVTLTLGVYFYI